MGKIIFKKQMLAIGSVFVIFLMFASCSNMPEQNENMIYTAMAETSVVNITETYEALPPTETPTATPTEVPSSTPTEDPPVVPTAVEIVVTDTPRVSLADKAEFVSVLPSPNQFKVGQVFNLTWQIKNVGISTWSGKYKFFHLDGIRLANQDTFAIDTTVEPGGILTVSMLATAPDTEGSYQTTWAISNPDGIVFYNVYYNLIVGDTTYITDIVIDTTATPSSLDWMCSDPDRSILQGSGCKDYCTDAVILSMAEAGKTCYANGTRLSVSQ